MAIRHGTRIATLLRVYAAPTPAKFGAFRSDSCRTLCRQIPSMGRNPPKRERPKVISSIVKLLPKTELGLYLFGYLGCMSLLFLTYGIGADIYIAYLDKKYRGLDLSNIAFREIEVEEIEDEDEDEDED